MPAICTYEVQFDSNHNGMKRHVDAGRGVVTIDTSGLDFGNHVIGTVQRVPHEKTKQCHGQQNGTAHQQYCHTCFGALLARFPADDWCVSVGTLMAQFGRRGIVAEGARAVRKRIVARQCNRACPKCVWIPRHCTVPVQWLQRVKRGQWIRNGGRTR